MASTPVRVLLVDDHPVMRDGLQQLLERTGEFEVVGHAGDGEEAERVAKEMVPDLVIMDVAGGEYRMPRDVMRRVFRRLRHMPEEIDSPRRKELTSREKEILTQFAQGMSYAAIAETRGNRSSTVRNTISHIQDKLGFGSKQEVVVWAVRNGLVD